MKHEKWEQLRVVDHPLTKHKLSIMSCLLYTSDAADDLLCVDLGGRRIIQKKKKTKKTCEL